MNLLKSLTPPDVLSLANAILGFCAILLTLHGAHSTAVLLVLLAALCDGVDGFLARRMQPGVLGVYLDSLCDLVSFGIAPAVIAYEVSGQSPPAAAAGGIYLMCGLLRLARFNLHHSDSRFEGLPITCAGPLSSLGTLVLPSMLTIPLLVITSALMISSIPYPKPKDSKVYAALLAVVVSAGILFWIDREIFRGEFLIFLALCLYLISPVVIAFQQIER